MLARAVDVGFPLEPALVTKMAGIDENLGGNQGLWSIWGDLVCDLGPNSMALIH